MAGFRDGDRDRDLNMPSFQRPLARDELPQWSSASAASAGYDHHRAISELVQQDPGFISDLDYHQEAASVSAASAHLEALETAELGLVQHIKDGGSAERKRINQFTKIVASSS